MIWFFKLQRAELLGVLAPSANWVPHVAVEA